MRAGLLLSLLCAAASAFAATPPLRFDFGADTPAEGWTVIGTDTRYDPTRGYGIVSDAGLSASASPRTDAASPAPPQSTALVGHGPFFFAVRLPEGNYDVTVALGDPAGDSDTTVKAETRRLMLESVRTSPAAPVQARTFTVNLRTPELPDGGAVAIKPRERQAFHWDDTLILEFSGPRPAVASVEIRRNDDALTVFLAGDSTVTDQPGEPWCGWGQMLPRFFPAGVAVANHAESGLSFATFRASRRLDKILSRLRAGDYVLMQFGHNDQKEKGDGIGAFTSYADSIREFVSAIRRRGGIPVLVTPMYRRRFDGDGLLYDTLGDFPVAMRKTAVELNVPVIDLHAMSGRLFAALGPGRSKTAFVHFAAGEHPGFQADVKDDTHSSAYGAYELARCVVEGIRAEVPALAARLTPDAGLFDPSVPDDPAGFMLPPSPLRDEIRIPEGDGR